MTAKDWSKMLLFFGTLFLVLSALALLNRIPAQRLNAKITELEKQIQILRDENETLQIELAKQTGLEYIDAQAERLGLIRPTQIRFIQKNKMRSVK